MGRREYKSSMEPFLNIRNHAFVKKKIKTCERPKALSNQTKANVFTQAYTPNAINEAYM